MIESVAAQGKVAMVTQGWTEKVARLSLAQDPGACVTHSGVARCCLSASIFAPGMEVKSNDSNCLSALRM